jgi:hypothetical protein
VEKLTAEEIEARNMTMLAEITLDDENDKLNDATIDLEFLVLERQRLNNELKARGLARQERDQLTVEKAAMVNEEKEKRVQRNQLDKKVKELRKAHTDAKKMEGEVRKARGRKEKALRNGLEQYVLTDYFVVVSSYHGGDMEGNSIRRLMGRGTDIFGEVSTFIKGWLILGAEESDTEPIISDDEVDEVCQAFGKILVLLDEIFACMNTERGGVSNEVKTKLTNRLELARVKWNELNFSLTPKWHVLLNHAANQLADMNGFADMGEDCIERNHQSREKDRHRHSRLRNPQQAKDSQARFQHIRMLDDVVGIQNKVRQHSKRNLKRAIPLGVEREEQRKAKRVATRHENANFITNEPRLIMKTPKERTKQEYLQSLQEE